MLELADHLTLLNPQPGASRLEGDVHAGTDGEVEDLKMEMEEKEELMRAAMKEFHDKLSESDGLVNGIKYKQDLNLEIQIRIDYLNDEFDAELVEREMTKYKDQIGNFIEDIGDERVWNTILSNLRSGNI
jgi:hypothetical protein